MIRRPKVSVLMSVAGNGDYLCEALQSVFEQSYQDFELLLMNDGSSLNVTRLVETFSDDRLKLFFSDEQLGLAASLNRLFLHARGDYIARMDADDVCLPERFFKQVNFLERNPIIVMVGSWVKFIDHNGSQEEILELPILPYELIFEQYFRNPFIHPSIMVRHSILEKVPGPYDTRFLFAQDYELFLRILKIGDCANIPEPLLYYRRHSGQSTFEKRQKQVECHLKALDSFKDIFVNDEDFFQDLKDYHKVLLKNGRLPSHLLTLRCRVFDMLSQGPEFDSIKELSDYVRFTELREIYRNRNFFKFGLMMIKYAFKDSRGFKWLHPKIFEEESIRLFTDRYDRFPRL